MARELLTADLSKDPRSGGRGSGTVMALPLQLPRAGDRRGWSGIDPQPSATVPSLGAGAAAVAPRHPRAGGHRARQRARRIQKSEALSVTDDLTQLSNSRYLNVVLRRETKRAMRSGRPLSMLFLDLDGFKQVNDNHGHLAGSKALVEAGAVIRSCARETDVVARFGGDEFALILPDTGPEGAKAVAAAYPRTASGPTCSSRRTVWPSGSPPP